MSDRAFELYRLDTVTFWPESEYKSATLAAIADRINRLNEKEPNNMADIYLTTPEEALAVLTIVKTNPVMKAVRIADQPIPAPSIKRPDDSMFDRTGMPTDYYYLVWPNGYHEPAGAILQSIHLQDNWPPRIIGGYTAALYGHKPAMPGTTEGITWKD